MPDLIYHDNEPINIIHPISQNDDTVIYDGLYGNTPCIIKQIFIDKQNGIPSKVFKEIAVLKKIKHKNIVHLYTIKIGSTIEQNNKYIYNNSHIDSIFLILEKGVSSLSNLNKSDLSNRRQIVENISCGLKYLHDNGYIHGDLSLNNIVGFKKDTSNKLIFKIIDFGCATKNYRKCVRPIPTSYVAPIEVLGDNINNIDLTKIDSWSLGCISYYITTGELLFENIESSNMTTKILHTLNPKNDNNRNNVNKFLTATMNDINLTKHVAKLINLNKNKRISISQFYDSISEKQHYQKHSHDILKNANMHDIDMDNIFDQHGFSEDNSIRSKLLQLFLMCDIKNDIPIENIFLTFRLLYTLGKSNEITYVTNAIILFSLTTKIVSFVEISLVNTIDLIKHATNIMLSPEELLNKMFNLLQMLNWDIDTNTLISYISEINNDNKMHYLIISLSIVCDRKYDIFSMEYLHKIIMLLLNCMNTKKTIYVENVYMISHLLNNILNSIKQINDETSVQGKLILEYLKSFSIDNLMNKLINIDISNVK